jgi:hypothetical protein
MGMLVDGEWLAEQRCSFFVGERSVLCGSVRIRVHRAYLKSGIVETGGNDGGTADRFRKRRDGRIESTDCVDSHGCVPDAPDDFMPAKNENIG